MADNSANYEPDWKRYNWWLVVIPDSLNEWSLPDDMMDAIEKIETVYLINRAEVTHVCEMTPSYWLTPIETRPVLNWEYEPDNDAAPALFPEMITRFYEAGLRLLAGVVRVLDFKEMIWTSAASG